MSSSASTTRCCSIRSPCTEKFASIGAMVRPDYAGDGFVNLVASLVEARGGIPRHPTLNALPVAEIRSARNLVFLIIDGLGDHYLQAHGSGGTLARHRRGAISAVFPSTTASAITTSFTGATPLEHGLTGWFTYFSEAACVGAPLPFQRRGEKASLGVAPERIFPERSLFDALATRSIVVSYRPIVDSQYNRHHCGGAERRAYDDLAGFVEQVAAAVRSGPEKKFVYAYWPAFDSLAHQHGVGSAAVRAHFDALDAAFGELASSTARRKNPSNCPLCSPHCSASHCAGNAGWRSAMSGRKRIFWRRRSSFSATGPTCGPVASWPRKAGSAAGVRTRASPNGSATSRLSCGAGAR